MEGSEKIKKGASVDASANGKEAIVRPEDTIDQVRDLLFGSTQRSIEKRLVGLREEMQASLRDLREEFSRELAALQAMVLELERNTEKQQLASHEEIGAAISKLGATISELGSGRAGK